MAGSQEIGGILMGEHIGANVFRIVDVTIQRQSGTIAFFVRTMTGLASTLRRFYRRTNNEYRRFNYLGEWHSHPSFRLEPSATDVEAMLQIVGDAAVGANFAVLLIVQLILHKLQAASYIFLPGGSMERAETVLEQGET